MNKRLQKVTLLSIADVFLGMTAAWAITFFISLTHFALTDTLNSFMLTILTLLAAISIRVKKQYD